MKSWMLPLSVGLLLLTNLLWFFNALDHGVSLTYVGQSAEDECRALDQALRMLPRLADRLERDEVLWIARETSRDDNPYEKEGAVWMGSLGFRFDSKNRLAEVVRAWEPKACQ